MICPCKECIAPKRKPGCHSTCPEYKEWREWLNKRKNMLSESEVRDFILDSIERNRRLKNAKNSH